jgi:hypothetical protein
MPGFSRNTSTGEHNIHLGIVLGALAVAIVLVMMIGG